MIALIDADSLLYKIGFAIEDKTVWNECDVEAGAEEELEVDYTVDLEACETAFMNYIENILFATECDEAFLVFTGNNNFRESNPLGYKEHRVGLRKPEAYNHLLNFALENYKSKVVDYMEADDYVVYLKTTNPSKYFLCAIDKDVLYQTEGIHYNYHTDSEVEIGKLESIRYAYYQTLTGDQSDGYKGCKQIGHVKATKILADCTTECEMWRAVVETYISKKQTVWDAIQTMRLANMHQFNGKQIEYWRPPCKTEYDELTEDL